MTITETARVPDTPTVTWRQLHKLSRELVNLAAVELRRALDAGRDDDELRHLAASGAYADAAHAVDRLTIQAVADLERPHA